MLTTVAILCQNYSGWQSPLLTGTTRDPVGHSELHWPGHTESIKSMRLYVGYKGVSDSILQQGTLLFVHLFSIDSCRCFCQSNVQRSMGATAICRSAPYSAITGFFIFVITRPYLAICISSYFDYLDANPQHITNSPSPKMQSILKACEQETECSESLQVSMTWKTLSDCKLFSLLSSCQMIFLPLAHAYTGQTNACLFGHMWGNKCNYKQDVITIALLLKLLFALTV